MLNSKNTIICLIARQIKKTQYKCLNIIQHPQSLEANVRAELDLSDHTTKANLKNAGIDTSYFAKKSDLANLKSDVDKLDIDILKNLPITLSNLKSKEVKLDTGKLETTTVSPLNSQRHSALLLYKLSKL